MPGNGEIGYLGYLKSHVEVPMFKEPCIFYERNAPNIVDQTRTSPYCKQAHHPV
mgnify:FL=1